MKTNTVSIVVQHSSNGDVIRHHTVNIEDLLKLRALLVEFLESKDLALERLADLHQPRHDLIEFRCVDVKCIAALIALDYVSTYSQAVPFLRRALESVDWSLRSAVMRSVAVTEKYYRK